MSSRAIVENKDITCGTKLALGVICLLGGLLRLYQLGNDGFWFDELGVALVLQAPDPIALLGGIRAHVMAMPLDYTAGWIISRFCQGEFCLRLPSAVWGTLTLPVAYLLFARFVRSRTALVAVFLLAVTPQHLFYSQELRFYAAMVFFYTFATYLLHVAVKTNRLRDWAYYGLVVLLGAYFHVYVLLVFVHGVFWLLPYVRRKRFARLSRFSLTLAVVSAAVLPGYLYFRPQASFEMFSWAQTVVGLFVGLGWLPQSLFPLRLALIWYLMAAALQISGLVQIWRSEQMELKQWFLGSLVEVILVIGLNAGFNYAFRGRQVLFIVPLSSLIVSRALDPIVEPIVGAIQEPIPFAYRQRRIFLRLAFLMILTGVTTIALVDNYAQEKSPRRELSVALAARWKPGVVVRVTPAWETKFYGYYLKTLGYDQAAEELKGIDIIRMERERELVDCWITPDKPSKSEVGYLEDLGLRRILFGEKLYLADVQQLWCLSEDTD